MAIPLNLAGCPLRIGLILPVALAASVPVAAQHDETSLSSGAIADLLADLTAGNDAAALARIDRVESLSGLPRLVTTPADVVALLSGCELTNARNNTRATDPFQFARTEWQCDDGPYEVVFIADRDSPFVTVAELSDAERIAQARAGRQVATIPPPAPPRVPIPSPAQARPEMEIPPTPPHFAEQAALCERLGATLVSGEVDPQADWGNPQSRFIFGFHNPFYSRSIVEADGEGLAGAYRMLAQARETLGNPRGYTCEAAGFAHIVRWEYDAEDRRGFAFVTVGPGNRAMVDMRYATRERLIEAAREAGAQAGS